MDAARIQHDGLSSQVMRLLADTRRHLAETQRLLVLNAKVLDECQRIVLKYHPEAACAIAALGEEVAARVAECGPTEPGTADPPSHPDRVQRPIHPAAARMSCPRVPAS
jgi:ABC-type transporter Mla subunit MlaD